MFDITSILIVYNIEKWFSDPSMGQVGALCIFVLIATMFLVVKMCMDLLWQYDNIAQLNYYLSWIFSLLPSFALAAGLMEIGMIFTQKVYSSIGKSNKLNLNLKFDNRMSGTCTLDCRKILRILINA